MDLIGNTIEPNQRSSCSFVEVLFFKLTTFSVPEQLGSS